MMQVNSASRTRAIAAACLGPIRPAPIDAMRTRGLKSFMLEASPDATDMICGRRGHRGKSFHGRLLRPNQACGHFATALRAFLERIDRFQLPDKRLSASIDL